MDNFNYCNPTRIVFGRGTISQLSGLVPKDGKVLVTCGGGSIRSNGVYDQVMKALAGHEVIEFWGIQPNPAYETLMKAVDLARREKAGFLLAVGGGSVLDGTKFIAAAIPFSGGDPWKIVSEQAPVKQAVPLGSVMTLPATGSEMNQVAVVSRTSTREKLPFFSDRVFPVFSVLDPETTFSLPRAQVRNGIVDAFVHVTEQYLNTTPSGAALQDRQAEAILQTLVERGPVTLERPEDYAARADFVWSATQALNGLIACGVVCDWGTHMIGHELTAFYGLAHAESLAVVLPHLLRYQIDLKRARLAQYGRRVWGIEGKDDVTIAEGAVARTEAFFHTLGMPTHLSDFKVLAEEAAARVKERLAARGMKVGEGGSLDPDAVAEILKRSG